MNEQKAPTKRDIQAEERREQLLEAALELFSSRGWEGTSMKELADSAGVAPGLIYHYFESKEDLLAKVVERYGVIPELRRVLLPSFERPASEILPEVAQAFYDLLAEKGRVICIFVREGLVNEDMHERWVGMTNEGCQLLARYLAARVAAGELREHNTEVTARMILHTVAMLFLVGAPPDRLRDLVEIVFHGVMQRTGPKASE